MPSVSQEQQRFFGADLGRAAAEKKTKTGLGKAKLEELARAPRPQGGSAARVETAASPAVSESARSKAAKLLIRR